MRARRAKMSRMSWVRSMTLTVERLFQIALLGGGEILIEDDDVGRLMRSPGRQFLDLAGADQGGGFHCGRESA